jgi:L-ascorbate metabolism protein UlaG (beta-lactamase superfamily)
MDVEGINIEWLGHASFRINEGKVIYIDPYEIDEGEKADIIFVTHAHYDHCSIADLKKIVNPETVIVAPPDCQSKFSGKVEVKDVVLAEPGKKYTVEGVEFETVPSYNKIKEFHPKINEWVGYIITIKGKRIYHPGDSDFIKEMDGLNVDVAFLPVSGTYVMDAEEAAEAAKAINAKVFIPMHYGKVVIDGKILGTEADAERFKELCNKPVIIFDKV